MKYLPLIWSGIWRKPGRTALVLLQVAVAFALFGVMQGMKTGVERAVANTRADVLFVGPADFGGAPLPLAYLDRLRSIPGMKSVSFADGFLGTYQRPTEPVFVLALQPTDLWLTLVPEIFQVLPKDLAALAKHPQRRADHHGYRQEIRLARRGPDSPHVEHPAGRRIRNLELPDRGDGHGP